MSPDRMKETDELEKVTLRSVTVLLIGLSLPYNFITYSTTLKVHLCNYSNLEEINPNIYIHMYMNMWICRRYVPCRFDKMQGMDL